MKNLKFITTTAFIFLGLTFLTLTATTATSFAALSTNEQNLKGIWFNEATNGQGVIADVLEGASGNTVFMSWYTFTANGQNKLWLVFQKASALQQSTSQSVDLYIAKDRGQDNSLPRFNQPPPVEVQKVGVATIQLLSATNLRITFAFDPAFQNDPRWSVANGEMNLTKITGTNTTLTQNEQNLIGTWFNPQTAGQGIQSSIIPGASTHTIFMSWYTYANNGEKLWLILQGQTTPNSASHVIDLYIVPTNGFFNAPPARSVQKIGTANVQLMSATNLRITFGFEAAFQNDPRWTGSPLTMDLTRIGDAPAAPASHLINTQDRNAVLNAYRTRFLAPTPPMNWTGNIASCVAGTTSTAYQQRTIDQINYFRGMAGVSPAATVNPDNTAIQEAVLIMAANGTLTHNPQPHLQCYTSNGATAARQGLLATPSGPLGVNEYMFESGPGNYTVGHRRFLLYKHVANFATGNVGNYNGLRFSVVIGNGSTTGDFVAWPSPGYFPNPLFTTGRRWSLTVTQADFRQARINMKNVNTNQDIIASTEPVVDGYGDNTLAWIPNNFNPSSFAQDVTVQITVSNVLVGGTARTFQYNVTFIPVN